MLLRLCIVSLVLGVSASACAKGDGTDPGTSKSTSDGGRNDASDDDGGTNPPDDSGDTDAAPPSTPPGDAAPADAGGTPDGQSE